MFHHVAKAPPGTLLFRRDPEGMALWIRVVRAFPELVAVCVMPDHVHLVIPHDDPSGKMGQMMSAYARWRNAARGQRGPVWGGHPPPERLPDDLHLRRTVRYVHLNPCRARLVDDPLAWRFSSHSDRVGFALPGPIAVEAMPGRFHGWVSGDPSVAPEGTPLPTTQFGKFTWDDVVAAVCGVCRADAGAATAYGRVRDLAIRTAWAHHVADRVTLARLAGVTRARVHQLVSDLPGRGAVFADPALSACVRAVGDPRFSALIGTDLRATPRWARYRGFR